MASEIEFYMGEKSSWVGIAEKAKHFLSQKITTIYQKQ